MGRKLSEKSYRLPAPGFQLPAKDQSESQFAAWPVADGR
jgi:hypothetical protein